MKVNDVKGVHVNNEWISDFDKLLMLKILEHDMDIKMDEVMYVVCACEPDKTPSLCPNGFMFSFVNTYCDLLQNAMLGVFNSFFRRVISL